MKQLKLPIVLRIALLSAIVAPLTRADERDDFFEAKIRPVLVETCFRCHGGTKTSGSLRIDAREGLLKGGESGAAIVPGKPDESLLIQAIRRLPDVAAMPPEKDQSLRADQVADFVAWVKAGAVWPAKSPKLETAKHWSFLPIRGVAPPDVQDQEWVKNSIDAFIRAKQEAAGIQPAPPADKLALIRRATFDLTGLPPTPDEIAAFVHDESSRAFETVVERLLKSPAYGERWGRHWLDIVRYADTAGETADYPVPTAWRYRNYVIDAFNADKPYDEFLREQIAGDVLANRGARVSSPESSHSENKTRADRSRHEYAELVTATGFLAISRRFGFDSENYHHLTIQDTIDTLGQTVLGLSLGCARCHDHKFDPVSMHDYYALYGIFDSSRYAFPGSEQKQKVRSLVPLVPLRESQSKWREYEFRVGALANQLAQQKQPVPPAMLRSLNEMDGDFELQAPAAGGSNGVLVPPWLYSGQIAVTNAAQSPFKNLYPMGKVGASVPAGSGAYRIAQAIHPRRTSETDELLFVNLDFRIGTRSVNEDASAVHRFSLGAFSGAPLVELLFATDSLSLRVGEMTERLVDLKPNEWHNLQLTLNLKTKTVSGRVGMPGATTEFVGKPFAPAALVVIECVAFDSLNIVAPSVSEGLSTLPAIEFDNLGVQDSPLAAVSTAPPTIVRDTTMPDPVALSKQLQELADVDGDFELQANDAPPANPWNPGPNSVVKLSAASQSPFQNLFPAGSLGIHMPNRGEYDGFGLTLPAGHVAHVTKKDKYDRRLFVSFDFRCANQSAGGDGSWRYYLGHGPGNSAAVELFFNGREFFRRSGDVRDAVSPLVIGEWYQVQLALDLDAKTYAGLLATKTQPVEFTGQFATGWDGAIDYSFIDSYGHLGGVRPALDADNFAFRDQPLPRLDTTQAVFAEGVAAERRTKIAALREQLAAVRRDAEKAKQELGALIVDGPFAMAYGMAEGTPHNVRMHRRGEPDQLGPEVPRGFLAVLGGGPLPSETPGSGRLELAQWLTRPENPLTARVMVNRIWQYHFGRGLVRTPNDFGVRGLPPTHPELLDHLASYFVQNNWSVKAMHRLIMLSATYQQSSNVDTSGSLEIEPASRRSNNIDYYATIPRRRLSAEEIRDSILAISGELDRTPARDHPFPSAISWGYTQHGPFSAVYDHNRRSVYLMTQRLKRHPFLALFDGPDPNATTAERLGTTVPTQALFFLNDPFVHSKAERWATRMMATTADEAQRIDAAWHQALGRAPSETERRDAFDFLAAYRSELAVSKIDHVETRSHAAYLRTLIGSNEFLHVD